MSSRHRYLPERHLLLEVFEGAVDLASIIALKCSEKERGVGGLGLRSLVDLRRASLDFEKGDVSELATWMRENVPEQLDTRTALLATGPLETGLALSYARALKGSKTIEVLSTVGAALRWLHLEPEVLVEHEDLIPGDRRSRAS